MILYRQLRSAARLGILSVIAAVLTGVGGDCAAQTRKGPFKSSRAQDSDSVGILGKWFGKGRGGDGPAEGGESDAGDAPGSMPQGGAGAGLAGESPAVGTDEDTAAVPDEEDEGGGLGEGPESGARKLQWAPSGRDPEAGIPNTGMVGLRDLIELALRSSDDVARRQEEIEIAEKRRDAERDLEDPELRFSFSHDNDIELQRPYTTRETRYIDENGRDVTSSVERDWAKGNTERRGRIRNDRNITRERITERVIPGVERDTIERTVETEERESRDESTSSFTTDSAGFSSSDRTTATETTRSSSTTREYISESNPFDPTHPDSGFRIRIRFPIPNWLERKQRIRQAVAEIKRAEIEFRDEQRRLVEEVIDRYERIEYLRALNACDARILQHAEAFLAELEQRHQAYQELIELQATVPDFAESVKRVRADELSDARADIFDLRRKISKNEGAISSETIRLAALAGIGDPDRIALTDTLVERDVDFGGMDLGYLKAMALLKRPDLGELRMLLEIAESETAEEKSRRIPMINFFDIDYAQSYEFGDRSKDEFGGQFGVSLPLWSLFRNKSVRASQREVDGYARRIRILTDRIGNEVDLAVSAVRSARTQLLQAREHVAEMEALLQQNLASVADSPQDSSRLAETRFENLELLEETRQDQVVAMRDYNQAIRALESAIGTDLGDALGKEAY